MIPSPACSRNPTGVSLVAVMLLPLALGLGGCDRSEPPDFQPASDAEPSVSCADDILTAYDGLLVLAPHPDDETLGFAGLITAYRALGKPVETVVVTDGDAYCGACRFWKHDGSDGAPCGADDLSNFATPAVDSLAEVRRLESLASARILGAPPPSFLGYPDTGLAAAWANHEAGEPARLLHRSDFSSCEDCTCSDGYGGGPATELSADTLVATLDQRIAATSPRTLIATTHRLDGHGDHAALGAFVEQVNASQAEPRPMAFAVIHAHTPKNEAHADCWYPTPTATVCPCSDEAVAAFAADPSTTWIADRRSARYQPETPAALPDDADYGPELQLCLPEALYAGDQPVKRAAIDAYPSQLGFLARQGELPKALGGLIDCSGYLISFVRSTEAFVLVDEAPASAASAGR
ncbi:MAG: PIG-L family deacetylase [Acidobacteriota bacterium]